MIEKIVVSQLGESLSDYFAGRKDISIAFLFGSVARGTSGPLSDLDIAVLLNNQPDKETCLETHLAIMGDIYKLTGIEEVDIVVLNEAPVALSYRVIRDGIILFCANRDTYILYRLKVVNEYLDFKPILERHESAIMKKARNGELINGSDPNRSALEHYRQVRERFKKSSNPGA